MENASAKRDSLKLAPECRVICGQLRKTRKVKRVHLRCATCLERRFYYGKLDRRHYTVVPALADYAFMNMPPVRDARTGTVLYYLIVDLNCSRVKRLLKRLALVPLLKFVGWLNEKRSKDTKVTARTGYQAHPNWGPMVIPHKSKWFYFYLRRGDTFIRRFFSLAEFFANW